MSEQIWNFSRDKNKNYKNETNGNARNKTQYQGGNAKK